MAYIDRIHYEDTTKNLHVNRIINSPPIEHEDYFCEITMRFIVQRSAEFAFELAGKNKSYHESHGRLFEEA